MKLYSCLRPKPSLTPSVLSCLLLSLILLSAMAYARSGMLRYPLTNDMCPTSSFGSWRAGHLHAGLDFSTGGITGVPVLAVDSCWVWRIRLWNGGYGKALYAALQDGKVVVYGHLSRFAPAIEDMVEARQDDEGRYEVELLFEPGSMRFGPGDTLAYSGETGSGPPHLHFEIRSGKGDHDKINPVPDFMDLAEGLDPVIKSVRIEPLDPWGCVDGTFGPVTIRPGRNMEALRICGAFGVSVEADDPVQCGRILLPVTYRASMDGIPVWMLNLDRFPFAKAHFVGGIYNIQGGSKYVRMFDAFELDFMGFTCSKPAGPAEMGYPLPGRHEIAVGVEDAWGNGAEVVVPFVYGVRPAFRRFNLRADSAAVRVDVEPEPPGSKVELAYRGGDAWIPIEGAGGEEGSGILVVPPGPYLEVRCRLESPDGLASEGMFSVGKGVSSRDTVQVETVVHSGFIEILARPSRPPSSLPSAVVHDGSSTDSLMFQPQEAGTFRAVYLPGRKGRTVLIETHFELDGRTVRDSVESAFGLLEPGGEVWFSGEAYRVRLRAPKTYSSRSLVRVAEGTGEVRGGFESEAGGLTMEPAGIFFNDRVEVLIVRRDDAVTPQHGVFAVYGSHVSFRTHFDRGAVCEFATRRPENLLILKDVEGPIIEAVTSFKRTSGDGKATFRSRITDTGSGVDVGSLRAFVDEEVAIVSIDPDTGRISGRTTKALPYGPHRLRLEAEDKMGNSAGREFTLDLSR